MLPIAEGGENVFAFTPPRTAQTALEPAQENENRLKTGVSYMPPPPWSAAPFLDYTTPATGDEHPSPSTQRTFSQTASPDTEKSSLPFILSRDGVAFKENSGMRRRTWVEKVGPDRISSARSTMPTPNTYDSSSESDVYSRMGGWWAGDSGSGSAASISIQTDMDVDVDEDSPYPEVRASVSNVDDPEMPAMTLRMWLVGSLLCFPTCAANMFFTFRQPSTDFAPIIILLLSYPLGKFLAVVLPITSYRVPLPRPFSPFFFTFNPGPWSIKEHTLVYILAFASVPQPYFVLATTVMEKYYNFKTNFLFKFLYGFGVQVTGLSFAGLCSRILVTPASMIWPQNLVICTLLNTLHADEGLETGGLSRLHFFLIVSSSAFLFYFLPGFLFTALSVFSFICWIVPKNVVVNQLFGAISGLGMNLLTFDWRQISWLGSPLIVPWWAELHTFIGFAFFFWLILPILYYTNVWQLSHFPMLASSVYDRFGNPYEHMRVLTPDLQFNETAYRAYSPLYLPGSFTISFFAFFAVATNLIVHTALYHGKTILRIFRKGVKGTDNDIHVKLMRSYPTVPDWWYAVLFVVSVIAQILAVEIWHVGVPIWMLALTLAVTVPFIIPTTLIFAITYVLPAPVNLLMQAMVGALFPGKPIVNMICKGFSVTLLGQSTNLLTSLKLGHYMKIPPRSTFLTQVIGTVIALLIQTGVQQWLFSTIPDICLPHAPNGLTCDGFGVYFSGSIIWGILGPSRIFGPHTRYQPQVYGVLIGALLPIPFWLLQRRSRHSWARYINTPLFLNGATYIPPFVGINHSAWILVGFIFQYLIRKRHFTWWLKYNYLTSASLDVGTTFAAILIFFAFQFRQNPIEINWWGNNVYLNTADYLGTPFRPIPTDQPLPWSTSD